MKAKVEQFMLRNKDGQSVLYENLGSWKGPAGELIFGPTIKYAWRVDGCEYEALSDEESWHLLPDASGFICFEKEWKPDNCVLRDAYGKVYVRLVVPRMLTGSRFLDSSRQPTSFSNISLPYTNPLNGEEGQFGVVAWVEYAGKYYFELDYHSGSFLWGKEVRD